MAESEVAPQTQPAEADADADKAYDPKNVQQLSHYVETVLQNVQDRFQTMSDEILSRIDAMGNRIDDLEKNIVDLMTQAGVDGSDK